MIFSCVVVISQLYFLIEARVFCEDENAYPWTPIGYSCPVTCSNVIAAVEMLRLIDIEKGLYQEMALRKKELKGQKNNQGKARDLNKSEQNLPANLTFTNLIAERTGYKIKDYNEYISVFEKLLRTGKVKEGFRRHFDELDAVGTQNGVCIGSVFVKTIKNTFLSKLTTNKTSKCTNTRKYSMTQEEFIKKITDMLNHHTHSEYKFTEEMTTMVLEKILGRNINLQNGLADVLKVIRFLKTAIQKHKKLRTSLLVKLRSSNCLGLGLPGCSCRRGYAEHEQKCVPTVQCAHDPSQREYISNVLVN